MHAETHIEDEPRGALQAAAHSRADSLNAGHLFEGIGGLTLGFERAGIASAWGVEIDRFCNRVLERRWPHVPRWRNVIGFAEGDQPPSVDVVTGGVPCQDLSVAGRRAGLAGERSGLFFEFARIVDRVAPTWILFENVAGLLSSAPREPGEEAADPDDDAARYHNGADFAVLLGELTGYQPAVPAEGWRSAGVCVGPKRAAAWRMLDSQYFGVPQRRKRVFVVCHPRADRAAAVLFEPESGEGHPPPSHQPGEEVAGTLGLGTPGSRGIRSTDLDGHGAYIPETAHTVRSTARKQNGSPERHDLTLVSVPDVAHAIRSIGQDASEDGTGRQPAFVVASPLTGGGHPNSNIPSRHKEDDSNLVVYNVQPVSTDRARNALEAHETRSAEAITKTTRKRSERGTLVYRKSRRAADHDDADTWVDDGIANTLNQFDQGDVRATQTVVADSTVRRLTITECERLQGFPDGWTCLEDGPYDSAACTCPDGPRVGAIGNAVTVNVSEWIARRILEVHSRG